MKLLRHTVSTCSPREDRGCDACGTPLTLGIQRTDQIVPTRRGPKCMQRCIPCSVTYLRDLRAGRLPHTHPDMYDARCTCKTDQDHAHRVRTLNAVWSVSYDYITHTDTPNSALLSGAWLADVE